MSEPREPVSIPLSDLFAPLKPCPFCGNEKIKRDDEAMAYCESCGAEAPAMSWQFRK